MISLAKEGPTGPINVVLAQMHLPNGAEIDEVKVNGKSVGYAPFDEQGRPSVVLSVTVAAAGDQGADVRLLGAGIGWSWRGGDSTVGERAGDGGRRCCLQEGSSPVRWCTNCLVRDPQLG